MSAAEKITIYDENLVKVKIDELELFLKAEWCIRSIYRRYGEEMFKHNFAISYEDFKQECAVNFFQSIKNLCVANDERINSAYKIIYICFRNLCFKLYRGQKKHHRNILFSTFVKSGDNKLDIVKDNGIEYLDIKQLELAKHLTDEQITICQAIYEGYNYVEIMSILGFKTNAKNIKSAALNIIGHRIVGIKKVICDFYKLPYEQKSAQVTNRFKNKKSNKKRIRITFADGKQVVYESYSACSKALGKYPSYVREQLFNGSNYMSDASKSKVKFDLLD